MFTRSRAVIYTWSNSGNHEDEDNMNHEDHQVHQGKAFAPLDSAVEHVVHEIIGAGLAVHRQLGPGFVEPVYDRAVAVELRCRGLGYEQQQRVDVTYRDEVVSQHRLDLVVERCVVVEVKAVRKILPIHQAQILSYLKASGHRVGLLMNFNVRLFIHGLQRFVR
jgi:GxxExxY protein